MDNGARPLRVGSKGVAACDIETLSTHGEDGEEFVGAEEDQYYEETQRDNDSGTKIEASKGSPPTQRLTQPSLKPRVAKEIIAGYKTGGLSSVNIETQQVTQRYQGSGAVNRIRTSHDDDASSFVTASSGGLVCLYDVRTQAPVFQVHPQQDAIRAVLYEHIGGQPCGMASQQIKVWDVRAKLPLYELSTGNNEVISSKPLHRNGARRYEP
ncbi:hypothetical protein BDV98DRAFT_581754 [Pterulicium gracile]|uniref:WD40-repeat-containing domain protein n=1 Tax=Pterulicium gracile TaxID=1884261 RepID=A0A5C3QRL0_9AGAR|nr:hypothetical protein BDV98DRAFT_581754 [Pterula gracilis]